MHLIFLIGIQEEKTYEKKEEEGELFLLSSISMIVDSLSCPEGKKWSHKWYRVKNSQRNVRARGAKKKQESECSAILKRKGGANVNGSPRGNKRDSQTMLLQTKKGKGGEVGYDTKRLS